MRKTLLITATLSSMSVTSVSFADNTPFHYDYKLDGFVSGVASIAVDPSYEKAICHIAIDKPDLTISSPNFNHYSYYHYSMTGDACGTAKLAFMTGEPVYLWGTTHGGGKNPEAVAIEMVSGNVQWKVKPKER